MKNVDYPVSLCKIPNLEKLSNLRVNAFGLEDEEIIPLYISKREHENVINLLLISNAGGQLHYCLI